MAYMKLGSKTVGSIVKLKENGILTDYLIVQKGRPSTIYDASCDGVWLLRKDIAEIRQWHTSDMNKLESSNVHAYLNGDWLKRYDANTKAVIKQVKLPYRKNGGFGGTTQNGANGLSCEVFLLSGPEVNFVHDLLDPGEGAVLEYFENCVINNADTKRRAYIAGKTAPVRWWLRSPFTSNTNAVWSVFSYGDCGSIDTHFDYGVRPALILPSSLLVADDGSVQTNTAPTTPGSITIPDKVHGGKSIPISWSAASDAENNLEGYVVEKSTDGGSTWTQIYQGGATSTTNSVAFGTESVMYRVRAYDSAGAWSSWRNSAQATVINNTAPTAPGTITVPELVFGGSPVEVSWTASADSEDNLAGYALERQADGGPWEEIFRGDALSFTDTATRGWLSVAYRVRAYDSENAYSGYTASQTRAVDNNTPPTVTCEFPPGTPLGVKSEGFEISYSVSDEDGDPVTVRELVDGAELKGFAAEQGQAYQLALGGLDFMKLLNGAHTVAIAASDHKVETVHKLTFTKSVTSVEVSLDAPMEVEEPISVCVLSVTGSIPADGTFRVEVTGNGRDDAPVWEDCTAAVKAGANYIFEHKSAAKGPAFNFRVRASRGASGVGGYITSIQGGFQ